MRIVIWGTGRFGKALESYLRNNSKIEFLGFTDSSEKNADILSGEGSYIHHSKLNSLKYDKLVIASTYPNEIISFIISRNLANKERLYVCEDYSKLEQLIFRAPRNSLGMDSFPNQERPNIRDSRKADLPISRIEVKAINSWRKHANSGNRRKVLFFPYYEPPCSIRLKEIVSALTENLKNDVFAKIFVCCEGTATPSIARESKKVRILDSVGRMTYGLWLLLSRKYCQPEDITFLSNSDIFFHPDDLSSSDRLLFDGEYQEKVFLAISRQELIGQEYFLTLGAKKSQDAWAVIVAQIPDESICNSSDLRFLLGKPRCDNRIARAFYDWGYEIRNPGSRLRIFHVHDSKYRSYSYSEFQDNLGPLLYVNPLDKRTLVSEIRKINAILSEREVRLTYDD